MSRITSLLDALSRIGRPASAAAILAVLSAVGCHGPYSDATRYQFDPALEWGHEAKGAAERPSEYWGVCNKARQVEKSFGVGGE